MFAQRNFKSRTELDPDWGIELSEYGYQDWRTLAELVAPHFEFGYVYGVGASNGPTEFAKALVPFATGWGTLIVDDAPTTWKRMEEERAKRPGADGVVVFARGPCPDWVTPIFTMNEKFR